MYGAKSQRLTQQIKISKISGTNPGWDVKIKRKEAKWKASKSNVIKFLWEVIYAYFYNWDRSLYLVLAVYDIVELIIEVSY